eukprot:TRINITY_DN17803_c0_g1_i2.p1 TRINITY_DN17803_c0_g1~~TRINITY_DN17803_c0_g1_i2.p1  ORF type:complete len:116 (+),score=10.43 TRINITY_DN17803_c0_g1_i2:83-430(+)
MPMLTFSPSACHVFLNTVKFQTLSTPSSPHQNLYLPTAAATPNPVVLLLSTESLVVNRESLVARPECHSSHTLCITWLLPPRSATCRSKRRVSSVPRVQPQLPPAHESTKNALWK